MATANSTQSCAAKGVAASPTIPTPCDALIGVSVRVDGTLENVGIGAIPTELLGPLADRLITLAEKIKVKAQLRLSMGG